MNSADDPRDVDAAEEAPQYWVAHVRRVLAEDERTAELGVRVNIRGSHIHLSGEVATEARKSELDHVLGELAPRMRVHNDVRIVDAREPTRREELR
ncbi:BON domain-containing protein [Amycolatopsis palatopharyngis]|uniref:BON domain-containing protein n=1 Tax=Amycolatopsis palatopharyngis TaxID=187982 RepID=UPI000E229E2D|nr:BON domain-containing protein [Amycolatopsis palatopharyngis]